MEENPVEIIPLVREDGKVPEIRMKALLAYCRKHNKKLEDLTPEEGDRFIVYKARPGGVMSTE